MGLKEPPESMYGVTEEEAKRLLTLGRFGELMDRVGERWVEASCFLGSMPCPLPWSEACHRF